MTDFATLVERFLDEAFALDPVFATAAGRHEHDGRWPDPTEAGRVARLEWFARWTADLAALRDDDLTADERIDRDRLLAWLDHGRFLAAELREESWNPLDWVYLLGAGLHPLLAREFAPLAERLASVAGRLAGIPAIAEAAKSRLAGLDGRPVARLHTEKAIGDLAGIEDLVREARHAGREGVSADPAIAAVLPGLEAAAERALEALRELRRHLREAVLPASQGDGRLGPDLYRQRLRHFLADPELEPADLLAEAERAFGAVRAEMVRLAGDLWPAWCPGRSRPDSEAALVRGVLDAIAIDHPAADGMLDTCRSALTRIEAFCRDRNVIGLADDPLEIAWTPLFLRSWAGAMLDSPGPFDAGERAFFFVTPCDASWSADRTESYLRENNRRQLEILTIHEAVPGHYLQGTYGNRVPSRVRSVLGDSMYAEGWAVYVTQVMIDLGFADGDPALELVHWKYFLRAAANAILDVRTHSEALTADAAMALMVDGAFQEEAEARKKWDRARLTSAQLSTYFAGSAAFWQLERDVRVRRAIESGSPRGAAAVPAPRVVGGLGETPGFSYRAHLESMISTGELPLPLLRRAILS